MISIKCTFSMLVCLLIMVAASEGAWNNLNKLQYTISGWRMY